MGHMMWIYAAFILGLSEATSINREVNKSQNPMTLGRSNQTTSASNNDSSVDVVIHSTFNMGSGVNLTCGNKTWNETLFVIWEIQVKYKACKISFSNEGGNLDTCNDGKVLRNTSSAQSYLHIPNFSNKDVGVYRCDSPYKGGSKSYKINVDIRIPPKTSAWLESENNKMVAVCTAERGKPAANISWSHMGNLSSVQNLDVSDGFFTVESRLPLSDDMDAENLSCAVSHPFWTNEMILRPKLTKDFAPWIGIFAVSILVFLAGFLYLAHKLIILRKKQQSDIPPPKAAPAEDVEEVEPYASYVQRVNSIYNSSADLFT